MKKPWIQFTWVITKTYIQKQIINDFHSGMTPLRIKRRNGLLYVRDHLIILNFKNLCKNLFCVAHDKLGHFGVNKMYAALQYSYYWPNMRRDLVHNYIPLCMDCQWNKSSECQKKLEKHEISHMVQALVQRLFWWDETEAGEVVRNGERGTSKG